MITISYLFYRYIYKILISGFIVFLIIVLFKEKFFTEWIYNEKYKLWWLLLYPVSYMIYYTIKLLNKIQIKPFWGNNKPKNNFIKRGYYPEQHVQTNTRLEQPNHCR